MAAQFTEIIGALARLDRLCRARYQFLVGTGLTQNQDIGVGGCDLANLAIKEPAWAGSRR